MKKLFYLLSLITLTFAASNSIAQTVIYSEDFDGAVTWTINTPTGPEGLAPNPWFISCEEEGVGSGNCGADCGAGDQTLHVGSALGDLGAAYFEAGAGTTDTDRRANSANISTIGQTNITLTFDLIGNGGNPQDYAEVVYSIDGGASYLSLATPLTSACCGGPCTGLEQGLWQTNTYALPATCENIANLRIGFIWRNTDDMVATDPSFAADNIELTVPTVAGPTASFTTPITTICVGTCIDFTNTSTGGPFTVTDWTFTSGTPATSAANNPTGICYNTAGTYAVSLSVTDGSAASDVETIAAYITVVDLPDAGGDGASNLCNNTTLNLNTLLSGADPGGTWAETTGTPSGQFTPGTGVLDGNALALGAYTFTYTVNPTAPCVGTNVANFTITIIDCSAGTPPTAAFTPSQTTICAGDCITFADNSTPGDITNWAWDFGGGATPNNFVGQNPGSVCFNTAGTYTVTLGVINPFGNDNTTVNIVVRPLPTVTANAAPSNSICAGDPVTLSGGGALTYTWTGGVTDGVAFNPAATNTYTVTGIDGDGCENTANVTVTVTVCEPMVAGFSYQDNICLGDCITLTDTTTGAPISWSWDFGGGATPNTSTDQNPVVCFTSTGTFNIQLTTTDAGGTNSSTTNSISVFGAPTVIAENDTVIDIGYEAIINATGSGLGSYVWIPSDAIDCDTCSNAMVKPEVNTTYYVTFTDVNGCQATDSVMVYVNFIEGIGVPQAFSPNGDGNNDILFVRGFGIENMKFSIYNRYGQLVFETTDQNIGWDGMFKGREENPGVFVWVLEYTFINGNGGLTSGNTTLIR